jgi:hypothetical protein
MKIRFAIKVILLFLFLGLTISSGKKSKWGFFGHQRINRMAVFTLPPEMVSFYKKHIDFITEHAVDPDKRRYGVKEEAPRHYIDIDHYGTDAFKIVPIYWNKAVDKFTEDTLMAYGIVPWHIEVMVRRLQDAFKKEDIDRILHLSADLGHYIADAHVPLHTTENYNGQLTNQRGIHGFWESRIPELKAEDYDYFVGRAKYIDSPIKTAWKIIKESHAAVDSVLKFEADLNSRFPADKKYGFENRGNMLVKTYSQEYTNAYDKMISGQVERRMRASIIMVGNLWYTAWINAGKPDLNRIGDRQVSDSLKFVLQKQEENYQKLKDQNHNVKGHND